MARQCSIRAQVGVVIICLITQAPFFLSKTSNVCCAAEEPENMLRNSGFEDGGDGQPAEWRSFVVPAEGVETLWDKDTHHSGKRALMLHIETPYADEVYNNWYQHISAIPAGKKLLLSGYIKSKDVTEAAVWLQCWRDNSGEILRFATTSLAHPISGTVDWTRVETSIVPPPETSFLTVRCVVAGKGTAWFDDLLLAPEREREEVPHSNKADIKPENADVDTLKQLLEAHKILLETNRTLAENANLVAAELARIREELNELKRLAETWRHEEENKAAGTSPEPEPVPPFRPAAGKESASPNSELLQ